MTKSSILRKCCLRLEVLEDRSLPSTSPLGPTGPIAIPDPSALPQTREHVLLARQVSLPAPGNQGWGPWETNPFLGQGPATGQ